VPRTTTARFVQERARPARTGRGGGREATPLVVELGSGRRPQEPALIGGKAAGLEALMAARVPCPPAFCVTTAALDLYLRASGLARRLNALLQAVPCERTFRELRALAYAEELPDELSAAVAEAAARLRLRAGPLELLAVRSSAPEEDGARSSFAGLHETELGIRPGGVPGALRKCWASLWTGAASAYRARRGRRLTDASMAVIVQALIPAQASAVVFTANPLTGATDELVIHATHGLGVTLVDGEVTPDAVALKKDDLAVIWHTFGDQHLRVDPRRAGGLIRSHELRRTPVLRVEQCRQLAELALEVEQRLAVPVDIEAALGDRWYLIQARPITALTPDATGAARAPAR
jgi:phosphoenolpyruvate synthase/pyruvate phosphate dikinase